MGICYAFIFIKTAKYISLVSSICFLILAFDNGGTSDVLMDFSGGLLPFSVVFAGMFARMGCLG